MSPAVLYMVDHDASCVYMQRVPGCSLKALLQDGALKGAGVSYLRLCTRSCQYLALSPCSPK
jgi:hypothetical protein